tara:strand:- start:1007 stop:1753 length:747 start_codon:yes stop_codon:yes gene_type:complete
MKSIEIKSSKRENIGKVDSKSLRKNGSVPCVLYGGKENIHFSATEISFKDLVYTASAHTVTLDFGDKKINAILQDIQFHPVSDRIVHADFYEIHEDKDITMDIPVIISGSAPGVLNDGGMLSRNKRKIRIKAIPSNLPDSIDIDISSMQLGDKITMADIQSDKYEILHPENTVVCQVRTSRASMIIEEPVLETEGEEGEEGVEGAEGAAEGAEGAAEGAAEGKKDEGAAAEGKKDEGGKDKDSSDSKE